MAIENRWCDCRLSSPGALLCVGSFAYTYGNAGRKCAPRRSRRYCTFLRAAAQHVRSASATMATAAGRMACFWSADLHHTGQSTCTLGVCGAVSGMPRRILQVPLACFMTSTPRCAALSQFARLQQANNDAAGGTSIGSQDKHEAQRRHAGLAVDMCRRATCRRGVPCGHMPATGIGAPCGHYLDAPAPPWGDF